MTWIMTKLRDWRKSQNLKTSELAGILGMSQGSLSRIERGEQWPDRQFFENVRVVTDGDVTANDFLSPVDGFGLDKGDAT